MVLLALVLMASLGKQRREREHSLATLTPLDSAALRWNDIGCLRQWRKCECNARTRNPAW